jgi:hypothetical protein
MLHKLIGLNWWTVWEPLFLGTRARKVWFCSLRRCLLLKKNIFSNSIPIFLEEKGCKSIRARSFNGKLERALNTFDSEGMEQRDRLSSLEMIGGTRSSNSSSKGGLEVDNRLEKWETKLSPMAALSDMHSPILVLRKLMALDLLPMMVEA